MELPEKYQSAVNELGKETEVKEYTDWIDSLDNVEKNGGYLCYWEDNEKIADTIPKDKIVIDVGCSFGLRHILYKDHKMYIGVQKFVDGHNCRGGFKPKFRTFTNNSIILDGNFSDIAPILEPFIKGREDEFFGIAYSSLWNDKTRNEEDIEWFRRLFPKNYIATNILDKIHYDPPTTDN
jgi:hypothetical protein